MCNIVKTKSVAFKKEATNKTISSGKSFKVFATTGLPSKSLDFLLTSQFVETRCSSILFHINLFLFVLIRIFLNVLQMKNNNNEDEAL